MSAAHRRAPGRAGAASRSRSDARACARRRQGQRGHRPAAGRVLRSSRWRAVSAAPPTGSSRSTAGRDATTWTLDSNLGGVDDRSARADGQGRRRDRAAQVRAPLRAGRGRDTIVARYGRVGQLTLERRRNRRRRHDPRRPARARRRRRRGRTGRGCGCAGARRPECRWLAASSSARSRRPRQATSCPWPALDVTVHELDLFGRRFNDLRIDASARRGCLADRAATGASSRARRAGRAPRPGRPNGRIVAHSAAPDRPGGGGRSGAEQPGAGRARANPWPEIDIVGRQLPAARSRPGQARAHRPAARRRLADPARRTGQRRRQTLGPGLVARGRAHAADHARRRAQHRRRGPLPRRASACPARSPGRRIEDQAARSAGPAARRRSTIRPCPGAFRIESGAGAVHQGRSGRRQAAGRAVAAVVDAPASRSTSRICSARGSPSTRSPATCVSRTA